MTVTEDLKSVQYLVNEDGKPTAVLVNMEVWEVFLNLLDDLADTKAARQALAELRAAGGRPAQAGWMAWEDIEDEWDA